jgi:hypothetical protein
LVAQSVLDRNDAPPAEVTLQVEILAVDSYSQQMAGPALTSEEYAALKTDRTAELFLSQSIRLTDNKRGSISVEEAGGTSIATPAAETDVAEEPSAKSLRSVGLRLSFHPQVSRAGGVQLSFTVEATAPAADETPPSSRRFRTRDVNTSVSMKAGEVTLLPVTFRVNELGAAFRQRAGADEDLREVMVAIGVTSLERGEMHDVLPPLPMGTEQQVQVRLR